MTSTSASLAVSDTLSSSTTMSDSPSSSTSSSSSVPAPSSSSAPMDVDDEKKLDGIDAVKAAIKIVETDKKMAESALKYVQKLLSALSKSPSSLAARKLREDNIALKKFVLDIKGATDIMRAVGFKSVEQKVADKNVKYLMIEEQDAKANVPLLDDSIQLLSSSISSIESSKSAAPVVAAPAVRPMCVGACGFYGDASTENYCSKCFKAKFNTPTSPPPSTPALNKSHSSSTTPTGTASSFYTPVKCSTHNCTGQAKDQANHGTLCDKCWREKEEEKKQEEKEVEERKQEMTTLLGTATKPKQEEIKRWRCRLQGAMLKLRAVHRFNLGKKPVQIHKNRCWKCNKKVGITGFECRCRYIFCAADRYADKHDCPYDIKSLHRKKLRKENEEIRAAKLQDKL